MNQPNVICFGEVLWDYLPRGRKAGGAPMNVAYHLSQLGCDSTLISKVGNDEDGKQLVQTLKKWGLAMDGCQKGGEAPTSRVEVDINEKTQEVEYDIVYPAAWDYITYQARYDAMIPASQAFVFGSLAARNAQTRDTLHRLLQIAPYKVCDINLRAPFYNQTEIKHLLNEADLLKLNEHELVVITDWFDEGYGDRSDRIQFLLGRFNLSEIILTMGADGASYFTPKMSRHVDACEVKVNDTVGSGDSFLAAFLAHRLKKNNVEEALNFASALSAYVTTQPGPCPGYAREDINDFISQTSYYKATGNR